MRLILAFLLRIRWAYFHVNPNYIKFYMTEDEAHFQHSKTGLIHSDFKLKPNS